MTRDSKYREYQDSLSHSFMRNHFDRKIADFKAGLIDLTAKRFFKLNPNNRAIPTNDMYDSVIGLPISTIDITAGRIFKGINGGNAVAEAYSSLEPDLDIQLAPSGYVMNVNKLDSGTVRNLSPATAGKSGDITDSDANDELVSVVSASASDTNYIAILGTIKTTGVYDYEIIKMAGTTAVTTSKYFDEVYGAIILDQNDLVLGTWTAAVGNVTITNATTGTTLITITATAKSAGVLEVALSAGDACGRHVLGTVSALTGSPIAMIIGQEYNGDNVVEGMAWAASNDVLVKQSTKRYNYIRGVVTGEFATRTLKIDAVTSAHVYVASNSVEDVTVTGLTQLAETIGFKSSSAEDTTQTVTLFAVDGSNNITVEDIELNGTTLVESSASDLTEIFGIILDAECAGTLTALDGNDDVTALIAIATGVLAAGMLTVSPTTYTSLGLDGRDSKISLTNSNGSATDEYLIRGLDSAGSVQTELVTLSSGTITSANRYSRIDHIVNLSGAATEYLTIKCTEERGVSLGYAISPSDTQGTDVEVYLR